jgi:hypothetical protein
MSGLRVAIYPNDHRPAHVHVQGGGCEAVFNLGCPVGPPQLRENYGFMQRQAARIRGQLAERLAALCAAWSYLHGYD